ncbi:G-type lectin S-receptor-like serine/threonine-protein kinase At4g27290 [Cornus florida]|uniref:G-type lectin S-receptor-like serine/threonine-protein kinase At4g27290 n=1 Tax=Cornus florida TaxID=4283 RepID=UPI0028A26743|nr:G-type lectin S-receptor-like serine/threonine-protein kinase At4g27290 [Cornus florida]
MGSISKSSKNFGFTIILYLHSIFSMLTITSYAVELNTITTTRSLTDGQTMVSSDRTFELGFFNRSGGISRNRYLGIWYKKISDGTVVWVANRDTPLTDTSGGGVLKLTDGGILVLVNSTNTIFWSSSKSSSYNNTLNSAPVAQLLDSGNLVVKDAANDENFLWQSFDYPGDTLLPGMKLGKNLVTGIDRRLWSWKSSDDPSKGEYSYGFDLRGFPQIVLLKGSVEQYRNGPWNGISFSGTVGLKPNSIYTYRFVFNQQEVFYDFELINSSVFSRRVMNQNGIVQRLTWNYKIQDWTVYLNTPSDNCDFYGLCHAYGICSVANSPECGCLDKFMPRYPKDWDTADWSGGCVRRTPLDCHNGSSNGFLKYSGVKLPDTRYSWFNRSMNLKECETVCLKNCSCMAYANIDVTAGGSGCLLWFQDLIDIRDVTEFGQDIYIRMASSELGPIRLNHDRDYANENERRDIELPLLDFERIANATNNFSFYNKLGEGGFGPVYKGVLEEGQEIAVKRLSKNSRQGIDEFKNEVLCISKLQHRNLVKILGCCIQDDERMLIYEYLPNKSMDCFIFDKKQSMLLDWPKCYNIINGIARGLNYLHQDSRLRIIHRDLKANNILLDNDMNPKISDFGMARCFGGDEMEANTNRVVGTLGYMSPEYVMNGFFSVKSDVYSFGVLVLEIVSGSKNRGFSHPNHSLNLLGHAWTLHKEGKPLELIDASVVHSCNLTEAFRSIHIGLLCVQQCPEDRPNMSSVVMMLGSEIALPQPKEPGFYTGRKFAEVGSSSSQSESCSSNQLTVTILAPR